MYELFLKHAYLPALDWYRHIDHARLLAEAERNQRLPREDVARLQLEKLQALLVHAEQTTPFYARRFREVGMRAADVRSLDDLARLPLLSKQDIVDHGPEMRSPIYTPPLFRAVTSGSTGLSLRFEYDSPHEGWIWTCQDRAHRWWGIERWEKRLILWGRPITGGWRAQLRTWARSRARNSLHFNTFVDLDDAYLAKVVRGIQRFRPKWILAYGSSIGPLASYMDRHGIVLAPEHRPRMVEYTGDSIYAAEKETAERVLGAPVVPLYASGEAGGLSYTCPKGRLHVSADHILVEFLREDGTRAAPGEQAEIVVTTLNNRRMPMIRYRVGDLGSYSNAECPCGVQLPVMNLEVAKVIDRITTSTKKVVSAIVLDFINKQLLRDNVRGIRQFLVEQTGLDDFVLSIVREEPFDDRVSEFFVAKMREYLGDSIRVEVKFVREIPVSPSGKRRWFKRSEALAP